MTTSQIKKQPLCVYLRVFRISISLCLPPTPLLQCWGAVTTDGCFAISLVPSPGLPQKTSAQKACHPTLKQGGAGGYIERESERDARAPRFIPFISRGRTCLLSSCVLVLGLANLASCSFELVSIAPGPPDAEEDKRGSPRRKAATTIDTATAEEDVKDCDCACASSRTCLQPGCCWHLSSP